MDYLKVLGDFTLTF